MPELRPHFEQIQAHYDISDEFFALFLDPTLTYSCAYFESDDMTLEEAQIAKIDLALDKLGLEPGMTLLDVGCGWGATLRRAIEKYDVNVIGLTLSKAQGEYVDKMFDRIDSPRWKRVLIRDWEDFDEPVDRIVSIEAFEHFGRDRYADFFKKAHDALPSDGVMLLHTIIQPSAEEFAERGLPVTMTKLRFLKFVMNEIFPGGNLSPATVVTEHAERAGFAVAHGRQLRLHYARTLDTWAAALESNRDKAVAVQSEEVYDRYITYLTGWADLFREGFVDVGQYSLFKNGVPPSHYIVDGREEQRDAAASPSYPHGALDVDEVTIPSSSINLERGQTSRISLPIVPDLPFEVVLSEAPATGYEWELQNPIPVANFIDDTYDDDLPSESDIVGGVVDRRFKFRISHDIERIKSSRNNELAFKLWRPWQPDAPPIAYARLALRLRPLGRKE